MTAPRAVPFVAALRWWLGCLCLRLAAWCWGVPGFELEMPERETHGR